MDIALGSVMEAVAANLEGIIANRVAVRAMLVTGVAMYGLLLVAPEPVTKVIAVMMTAALVAYLGMDTLYSLRDGWRRLVARADAAATFDELRSAGEQFGKLMGANTTRILVMVAAAAMGSAAGGVAKTMATLPEAGEALSFAAKDGVVVEVVHTITIAEPTLIITLAPGAVAMSTIGSNGGTANPGAQPSTAAEREAIKTTAHGAQRIAGAGATRGGVLSLEVIAAVREGGRVFTQAGGGTVRVLEQGGRFNVVVEGQHGIITTFRNLSQKSLDRLAENYGWKPE